MSTGSRAVLGAQDRGDSGDGADATVRVVLGAWRVLASV